jgi:4-amino-4-deoxy-L-arabinose transferase-like glycosyltransferase
MTGFASRQWIIALGVVAIVMLTNLGGPRLWDRDEPRNAGCAREMLERGDWIVPTFNAELRTHKPVLLYWLIMSAYSALGVSEFSARLPSALCAIGTCLMTLALGRRLFPSNTALMGALALATSVMFVVAGRAATPDSVLIFCITGAMAVYVCGTFLPRDSAASSTGDEPLRLRVEGHYFPQDWKWQTALYAMMGLAVLAKGPVGLVVPTAVIGMFLLLMRLPEREAVSPPTWRSRIVSVLRPFAPLHFLKTCWYMRPLLAIGVAGAIALPWYIAVGVQTDGEFLRGFFFEHNLSRATQAMEGHRGGPLFYPLAILVGFFPWSIFAVPIIWDTVARLRRRDADAIPITFCLCWIGVFVGAFSLAQTKLPSYVTPCYPAVALLVGSFFDRWRRGVAIGPVWLPRLGFGILAFVGIGLLVALPMVAHLQLPGEEWLGVIGLVPLAAGAIGWLAERSLRRPQAVWAMTGGALGLLTLLFAVAADRVSEHQQNHLMLQSIFEHSSSPKLGSFRTLEPTWVFYSHRPVREFPRFDQPRPAKLAVDRPLTPAEVGELGRQQAIEFLNSDPEAFLITTGKRLEELQPYLPPDVEVVSDTPLFLKKDRLVAIGRKSAGQTAQREGSEKGSLR